VNVAYGTGPVAASAIESRAAQLLAALKRAEEAITLLAFTVLVLVLFADVLSRELSGAGLAWSRPLGVYANLFLTLVGVGLASAGGTHLRPRFADRWLPAAWQPGLARVREAVMALFFFGALLVSVAAIADTRTLDERVPLLGWPVWQFQLILPAVFVIAMIRHGCYAGFPRLRPAEAGSEPA
jgi:TRAP-type C4-dicarboxylate transport system permease small subunit